MNLNTNEIEDIKRIMDQFFAGAAWEHHAGKVDSISKIPGDASSRRYYRLSSQGQTFVVMRMEPFSEHNDKLPFIVLQRHLKEAGVDVPAIYATDPERGLMLLEDLGDATLLRHLQDVASADVERHLYERVIDALVDLQHGASPSSKPANIDAFKLRFDHEKLLWEMDNTIEHFYLMHLKRNIRAADRKIMHDGFSEICTFLADQPTVLAHRDFHSRNIMIKDDRLVMIDFQDARMGPATYDLASLLKDSYYQLEEGQIRNLIDYYIARREASSQIRIDHAHFHYEFDLMSVQRNFKAIGSFASFLNRRGDATYLKYIGNTFENIRRTLLRYPQYSRLREVLFHYYYF